jgi:short-subunit dehydrogenase
MSSASFTVVGPPPALIQRFGVCGSIGGVELHGTVCLVTGGTSGIGLATVAALRAAGAEVTATGEEDADLSQPGAAARVASGAGSVDVLVNCAGIGAHGEVESVDAATLLAVNVLAPIELTQALLPGMRERGRGHVVNVGSIVGHVGRANEAVYAATKAALAIFTESLREELRGTGVGVSLVTPVAVESDFFARRGVPYGRQRPKPLPPERVADAIVDAIRRDRAEVVVPRWATLAVRVHGVAPRAFRALARRFD